jgi:Flp pilus assembly protein CpaB
VDVPRARRMAAPSWLNARTLLGLLLFAGAVLGGHQLLAAASQTSMMWAAAVDVAAGTRLSEEHLRTVEVKLPADVGVGYALADRDLAGSVMTRPVAAGELVPVAWLAEEAAAHRRALAIPVTPEHAVGGALTPGDRVDVLVTFEGGEDASRSVWVGRSLEVLEVVSAGGLLGPQEAVVGITVAVSSEEAARLVFAIRNGDIDVLRSPGVEDGGPAVVRGQDFP